MLPRWVLNEINLTNADFYHGEEWLRLVHQRQNKLIKKKFTILLQLPPRKQQISMSIIYLINFIFVDQRINSN